MTYLQQLTLIRVRFGRSQPFLGRTGLFYSHWRAFAGANYRTGSITVQGALPLVEPRGVRHCPNRFRQLIGNLVNCYPAVIAA